MAEKVLISDAEWRVMKVLWRKAPQPAYDIAHALCESEGWDIRTVKSLLARLVKKGAVAYEQYKNLYLYRPLISEGEAIRPKLRKFMEQMFDGSLSMLLLHFSKHRKLSKGEVAEIKRMIREMEEQ